MTEYKSGRIIDGKVRRVIVDETGKIVNRNPTKEELRYLEEEPYIVRGSGMCYRCIEENNVTKDSILYPENACKERDKDEKKTGRWICHKHWGRDYQRYNPNSGNNIIKSMTGSRTDNLDPKCNKAKGDNTQKLACMLYGWEDLNKKHDNYKSSIDCIDKNGLFHQVQGRLLIILATYITTNGEERYYEGWGFGNLDREWHKKYEDSVCFCFSKDGKNVEAIYKFPSNVIGDGKIKGIKIRKNPSKGIRWYEKYRVKDPEELRKANEIWQKIIDKD